jgi:hypothetical protein
MRITIKFKVEETNDVVEALKSHQIIGRWVCDRETESKYCRIVEEHLILKKII